MIRARAWGCVSSFPGEAPSLFVSKGGGEAGSRGESLARAALFDSVQRCSRHDTRTCLLPYPWPCLSCAIAPTLPNMPDTVFFLEALSNIDPSA